MRTARAISIGPAIVIGASTMLGLAAALVGGPLTFLGSGFGGLLGLPAILLFGFAAAGVAAAAWILFARRRPRDAVLLFFGPIVVLTAFVPVAHALDPCDGGAWTLTSHVEGIPLCESWGGGVNIHTRFHLLMHALPAIPAVALYAIALRVFPVR